MPCAGLRCAGRERVILQGEGVDREAALEGRRRREAGLCARNFPQRGEQPVGELLRAHGPVGPVSAIVRRQCDARSEELGRVETGIDGQHPLETAHQQASADEQDQRDRHLRDDQSAAHHPYATATRGAAILPLDRSTRLPPSTCTTGKTPMASAMSSATIEV